MLPRYSAFRMGCRGIAGKTKTNTTHPLYETILRTTHYV
nr:MAG TPA: hypothetical protein [Caudoviricetes sp.]